MPKPYILIETANTHGGNFDYLKELVNSFEEYKENFGMKFQAFHFDGIALPDFSAYEIYKSLHFSKEKWNEIILLASKTKDVWLDIFDWYGIEILKENYSLIRGIKFQSSVLYNSEVFSLLQHVGIQGKKLILNVAAQSIDKINDILKRLDEQLNPEEILFEFGYQAYPTDLEDSGLSKISTIKQKYNNRLVFADHVDGKSKDAIFLPLVVFTNGVKVIEKHVMLEKPETKYDHFSSLTPPRFKEMVNQLQRYEKLLDMPFVNEKEKEYLNKTQMIPVLNKSKKAGTVCNIHKDFIFRRTSKKGLNIEEIKNIQAKYNVLITNKNIGDTIQEKDYRKARIGAIIVCRLHSKRLKQKALRKIGARSSVETCIKNVLLINNINNVCLATSTEKEDGILENYTFHPDVKFYKGAAEDVLQRMLDVVDIYKFDIVSRITADTPYPSNDIYQILLNSYFQTGNDYTKTINAPLGVNLSVISVNALKRIKEFFPNSKYSEYLGYYFVNNPEYFDTKEIILPKEFERNYRLTLDYEEDLILFNKIQDYLDKNKLEADLKNIYQFLDTNPDLAKINKEMKIKYETDPLLIAELKDNTTITKNN